MGYMGKRKICRGRLYIHWICFLFKALSQEQSYIMAWRSRGNLWLYLLYFFFIFSLLESKKYKTIEMYF